MGLQDRDYMRDVPIYRRLVGHERSPASGGRGGSGRRPPPGRDGAFEEPSWWPRRRGRTRPWAWFLLGVLVTLATVGYVAERGVPIMGSDVVAMAPLIVPASTAKMRAPIPIEGPERLKTGTKVVVEGTMPTEHGRVIAVRVRWNGGTWQGLRAAEAAENGSFRIDYTLDRPGTAQIRVLFPDGTFAYKWYRLDGPPLTAPSTGGTPAADEAPVPGSVAPPAVPQAPPAVPQARPAVPQAPPVGGPWPDGRIPYFNGAPEHEWALQQAVAAWNSSGARVRFERVPEEAAKVVITAGDDEPCGHGRAPRGYTPKSVVVVFGTAGTSCDGFTAARVLAHELGHVLGLPHEDGTCALMNTSGNYSGSPQCGARPPWAWRCRLIEKADAVRAVEIYGGHPAAVRSPALCPLYPSIEPPYGLRLVQARSTATHLAIAFRRPADAAIPGFLPRGGEPALTYAYTRGECAERPAAARYRWSVRPGQEETIYEATLGSGTHCFRVWSTDQLGRPSSGSSTLEIDVRQ